MMLFLVVAVAARPATAADKGSLRAGAARVEITQLMKADLPATGKFDSEHLYVRAIVIDNGATRAAILDADLGHLLESIWDSVSKQIAAELNCPVENIVISATHTHSSGMPDGSPGVDDPWVKQFSAAATKAVHDAKAKLEPARVGFGKGFSYLNVNRDAIHPQTHLWTQAPNLNAYSDKTVSVLKFVRPTGEPIAVYVNYAMHAIDGYLVGFLSSDFPGAMDNYIEDAFPSHPVAIFSQSASGDQNPLYLRPATNLLASRSGVAVTGDDLVRESVEEPVRDNKVPVKAPDPAVREHLERFMESEGALLGEEVIRVMTLTTKTSDDVRIQGEQKTVSCPGRKRTDSGREGMTGSYVDAGPVAIRLGVLGIGDVALTSVDAEIYSRILARLKAETPLANTVLVTIANGRADSGYIPDDESFGHNTFQVLASHLKVGCAENAIADGLAEMVGDYLKSGK
jgi:hypothetical protein